MRERKSDRQGTTKIRYLQIYTRWRYIPKEPCFFMLLSQETDIGPAFNLWLLAPRARAQNGMIAHCLPLTLLPLLTDCSWLGVENFCHYVFFGHLHNSSNIIHMAFPLSLVYLKVHIPCWNPQTNQSVKGQYVTLLNRNNYLKSYNYLY